MSNPHLNLRELSAEEDGGARDLLPGIQME